MIIRFSSDEVDGSPVKGFFVSRALFVVVILLALALGFVMAALFRGLLLGAAPPRPLPVIAGSTPEPIASASRPIRQTLAEPWLSALKDATRNDDHRYVVALAASASLAVPGSVVPHQYRIRSLIHLGSYQQANRAVHQALQLFPGDCEILLTAAAFHQATSNPLTAEKMLLQAVVADRQNPGAWRGLVEIYMRAGLWNLAGEVASAALARFPEDDFILLARADAARMLQNWPVAISSYEKLLRLIPDKNADICFKLALTLRLSGAGASQSLPLYQRAIEQQPDHVAALNDCAMLLATLNRHDEAIGLLPRLLEHGAATPGVVNTAGLVYSWADKPDLAEPLLLKAHELASASPEFATHLAMFYHRQNNAEKFAEFKQLALANCQGDQKLIDKVNHEIDSLNR